MEVQSESTSIHFQIIIIKNLPTNLWKSTWLNIDLVETFTVVKEIKTFDIKIWRSKRNSNYLF